MLYKKTFLLFLFSFCFYSTANPTDPSTATDLLPTNSVITPDDPRAIVNLPSASTQTQQTQISVSAPAQNPCDNTDKFPNKTGDLSKDKLEDLIANLGIHKSGFQTATNTRDLKEDEAIVCNTKIRKYEKALKELEQCTEAIKEMKEKKSEFVKDCGEFLTGRMQCSVAIMACKMCPNEEDFEDYDCVKIHNKTSCPAKSGEDLKTAKKKRDKIKEDTKDIQEKIADLEKDIVSKESDLKEALSELETEFMETVSRLERDVEDQEAELENQLKDRQSQIKAAVAKSLAAVQKEIDNFLKVSHSFENAITKVNMEYRRERRQIVLECEVQARGRLAQYRQKRRAAIRTGSLQISLSSLLTGRKSFAQIEAALLKKYNSECLSKRAEDFKMAETEYKQKLRVIEQQKEQYQDELKRAQKNIAALNQQATQDQNKLIREYAIALDKILERHQKEYYSVSQKYLKQKNKLLLQTKKIAVLEKQLREQKQLLRDKGMQLVREEELISHLKSKGVSSTEDTEEQFSKASKSFVAYYDSIENTGNSCPKKNKQAKKTIEAARNHLERDSSEDQLDIFFGDGGNL